MKKLFTLLLTISSLSSFAYGDKMGPEAVEMFKLMSNAQVQDCLANENLDLVNVKIEKHVYRCPGCNTYIIKGNEKFGDMVTGTKTITLEGKLNIATFGWVQTYKCSVESSN